MKKKKANKMGRPKGEPKTRTVLQIPDDVHAELTKRAGNMASKVSLQEYCVQVLTNSTRG